MNISVIKPIVLLAMLLITPGLIGCNAVEGFGKDLKHLGGSIEKKADKETEE